jgi:hypothetical protein
MLGGNESVLCVAANHGESGDALAERELRDSGTEGVNVADDVVARGKWKWRNLRVEAVAHEDVGVGDARREIFDADLTGAGCGKLIFDAFQNFWAAATGDDDFRISNRRHMILCEERSNSGKQEFS